MFALHLDAANGVIHFDNLSLTDCLLSKSEFGCTATSVMQEEGVVFGEIEPKDEREEWRTKCCLNKSFLLVIAGTAGERNSRDISESNVLMY